MTDRSTPAAQPADLARSGREDVRPPASELATALLGDRGLLVPLSAWGEPQQLSWPHPDRDPNIADLTLGLRAADGTTVRLRDLDPARHVEQRVEDDADIVTTELTPDGDATRVRIDAAIDPGGTGGTAVLILDVTLVGGGAPLSVVVDLELMLGGSVRQNATLVDPSGVLVAYRADRVLALGAARDGALVPTSVTPPGPQGSTREVRVVVDAGERTTLVLAFAHDHAEAVAAVLGVATRGADAVLAARRAARR
jgi:hypothetical protein